MTPIEIPDICEFELKADQVRFNTQTNGDSLAMKGLHFNPCQAATLAHLINRTDGHIIHVEIKGTDV